MATLSRVGDDVVVRLNDLEKAGALHGDVRVPFSAVRAVRLLANGPLPVWNPGGRPPAQ